MTLRACATAARNSSRHERTAFIFEDKATPRLWGGRGEEEKREKKRTGGLGRKQFLALHIWQPFSLSGGLQKCAACRLVSSTRTGREWYK